MYGTIRHRTCACSARIGAECSRSATAPPTESQSRGRASSRGRTPNDRRSCAPRQRRSAPNRSTTDAGRAGTGRRLQIVRASCGTGCPRDRAGRSSPPTSDQPDAEKLNDDVEGARATVDAIDIAANRLPQGARRDEQQRGGPDIHGSQQRAGHVPREPALHPFAGEQAVVRGEHAQQQRVDDDGGPSAGAGADHANQDEYGTEGERADEQPPPVQTNAPIRHVTNSSSRHVACARSRIRQLTLTSSIGRPPSPRVVITGIGVVSPFGVGRERFWDHVSRGCSGTRAITDFDATEFACRVAAPVSDVTIDDVPAIDGDGLWDAGYRADPKRYSRAALVGVIAAPRGLERRGPADRRAARRRHHRQRRRRHRCRRASVLRLLRRARPQGDAVRDSGLHRRHGVERDLDLAAAARRQPRAVVRLHELDRRDRLCGGADSSRARRTSCCRAAPTRASRRG